MGEFHGVQERLETHIEASKLWKGRSVDVIEEEEEEEEATFKLSIWKLGEIIHDLQPSMKKVGIKNYQGVFLPLISEIEVSAISLI